MTAKEQKIKEEWIKYVGKNNYNLFKDIITENGFTKRGFYYLLKNNFESDYIDKYFRVTIEIDNDKVYRPKSLQGLETNNGWIKIESENDLPSENGIYWVSYENDIYDEPRTKEEIVLDYKKESDFFTHYQPITKPSLPIY